MRWDWFVVPRSPLPWHSSQLHLGRSSVKEGRGGQAQQSLLPFLGGWRSPECVGAGQRQRPWKAPPGCHPSACPPGVLSFPSCLPKSLMSAAGGRPWEGVVLLNPFLARLLP